MKSSAYIRYAVGLKDTTKVSLFVRWEHDGREAHAIRLASPFQQGLYSCMVVVVVDKRSRDVRAMLGEDETDVQL